MTDALTFGDRRKLPARRKGHNQKFSLGAAKKRIVGYLRTGEYPDGTLGEVFIDLSQNADPTLRGMTNMFAIAISEALQHGCPLDTLVEQYVGTRFEPAGPVRDHDRLKMCTSLTDLVFRHLAISYLGRDELGHVKAEA